MLCAATCVTMTRQWSRSFHPMLDSFRLPAISRASWPNDEKRKSFTGTPVTPGPVHPENCGSTRRPCAEIHEKCSQRHGSPANKHPRCLGCHSDHVAQQQLQTTAPSRHHVIPGAFSSPHTRFTAVAWLSVDALTFDTSLWFPPLLGSSGCATATAQLATWRPPGGPMRPPRLRSPSVS